MKKLFEFTEDGDEYYARLEYFDDGVTLKKWKVYDKFGRVYEYAANDGDELNWMVLMLAKHDKGST